MGLKNLLDGVDALEFIAGAAKAACDEWPESQRAHEDIPLLSQIENVARRLDDPMDIALLVGVHRALSYLYSREAELDGGNDYPLHVLADEDEFAPEPPEPKFPAGLSPGFAALLSSRRPLDEEIRLDVEWSAIKDWLLKHKTFIPSYRQTIHPFLSRAIES